MLLQVNIESVVRSANLEELKLLRLAIDTRINYAESLSLTDEEKKLVDGNRYIEAIKTLRTRCGLCLQDAKMVIDKYKFRK